MFVGPVLLYPFGVVEKIVDELRLIIVVSVEKRLHPVLCYTPTGTGRTWSFEFGVSACQGGSVFCLLYFEKFKPPTLPHPG